MLKPQHVAFRLRFELKYVETRAVSVLCLCFQVHNLTRSYSCNSLFKTSATSSSEVVPSYTLYTSFVPLIAFVIGIAEAAQVLLLATVLVVSSLLRNVPCQSFAVHPANKGWAKPSSVSTCTLLASKSRHLEGVKRASEKGTSPDVLCRPADFSAHAPVGHPPWPTLGCRLKRFASKVCDLKATGWGNMAVGGGHAEGWIVSELLYQPLPCCIVQRSLAGLSSPQFAHGRIGSRFHGAGPTTIMHPRPLARARALSTTNTRRL